MSATGRGRWWAALLVAALASVLWAGGVANANTFPNNYDNRVADDAIHTYCLTSSYVFEQHKLVPEYAMYWLAATTDMSEQGQSCLS